MSKIKILEAPVIAAAPAELRADWVGIEIPLPTADDYKKYPPLTRSFVSSLASGDYMVLKEAVAKALEEKGKKEAARILRNFPPERYMPLKKELCEYLP